MGFFDSFSQIRGILKNIDLHAVSKLSRRVDLNKLMASVSKMDDADLAKMVRLIQAGAGKEKEKPAVNGDFYELDKTLTDEDRDIQLKVRAFMDTEIRPIANEYWNKAHFPMHIIP